MGTSADYFPYEFVDTANGDAIVGFDIEIAETITERLGYELKIEDMDFGSLLGALNSGRVDFVMAGMTPTEERKENADFSDIYLSATNLIMTKDESLQAIEDLSGKKIGVQTASIQENIAKEQAPDAELVSLNKIPEIVQELNTGRIDAMVIEDTVAQKYLDQDDSFYTFALKEDGEKGSAAAFKLDDELRDQFNEELNKMMKSGEIDELVKKWFSMEPTE
ncbi:MAG: transporter substrate-binding domain-containing protein [Exiguobacterium sp.]|nr:transporter substrate-binding domain-containing protein [Exiguobacterium sp.]